MPPMANSDKKTVVLGVTGASGSVFARRTLQMLEADERVGKSHLVIAGAGLKVLREELELEVSEKTAIAAKLAGGAAPKTSYLLDSDIGASIASWETSPSPWRACPSPAETSPPSTGIGR